VTAGAGEAGVTPGAAAEAFAAIVGARHVAAGDATGPWRPDGVAPSVVVAPASVEDVSRCLAEAARRGLGVTPAGAGSRLDWGALPRRLDVVLALHRLDGVLAHEPADLTLSVQAGARLEDLDARLRPHGQFLPLDPAGAERCTVGGLVATGAAGPYRARYGTMRDLLLGVTVVQADGTVVRGGGRVVKNVTGYDMPKLHVGALGTLGVVVEAHLRLHPRPEVEETRVFGFPGPEAAVAAAGAIRDTPVTASRLQLLDGATLGRLCPAAAGAGAALAVTVGSVRDAVRAQGETVADACARLDGTPLAAGDPQTWWRGARDAAGPGGAAWGEPPDRALGLRIGVRPGDLAKALRALEAAAAEAGVAARATAELANGVLHGVAVGEAAALAAVVVGARRGLAPLGGTCVVERAPAAVKRAVDVWGDVGPALGLMRRLKAELDPGGVLNPGRYVGGI
jgi:glycolate oxidase FAD binding subunit